MINKMLRRGFKLPHMSPVKVKKTDPTPSHEERQLAAAREKLEAIAKKSTKQPIEIKMEGPINFDHDDTDPVFKPQPNDKVPSFDETFKSSGSDSDNDEELNKFLEGIHQVDNPEYTDPDNPEYEAPRSTEHDFFIKNRSKESDSIAKVFMNLNKDATKFRNERNFKAAGEKQNEINDLLKYIKKQNENRIQE